MYSTPLRHSVSVVQKSPGVAARLLSTIPGRVKIGKASSFGGVEIRASKTKRIHPLTSGTDTRPSFVRSWPPVDGKNIRKDGNQDRDAWDHLHRFPQSHNCRQQGKHQQISRTSEPLQGRSIPCDNLPRTCTKLPTWSLLVRR